MVEGYLLLSEFLFEPGIGHTEYALCYNKIYGFCGNSGKLDKSGISYRYQHKGDDNLHPISGDFGGNYRSDRHKENPSSSER